MSLEVTSASGNKLRENPGSTAKGNLTAGHVLFDGPVEAVAFRSGRTRTTPSFATGVAPGGRDPHLTQPGGSWLRFTQIAIAAGRGDPVAHKGRDAIWTATDCFSGSVQRADRRVASQSTRPFREGPQVIHIAITAAAFDAIASTPPEDAPR